MSRLRLAVISTVVLYFASILVLGTAPLFMKESLVGMTGGIVLAIAVVIGAYWAWKFVGRGFYRRGLVLLLGYVAVSGVLSPVFAGSDPYYPNVPGQITSALTGSEGVLSLPSAWSGRYVDSCALKPGHESHSEASGYYLVSYGRAWSQSDAYCNGIGYLRLETYASGIAATASANANVWFISPAIHVPTNGKTSFSLFSVALHLSISGWQVARAGSSFEHSHITLQYAMKLVRDDGYQPVLFTRLFQGPASFGGGYDPVYKNMVVDQGHSYNIVVMFNATSYSDVLGPGGTANAGTCFGFAPSCGKIPPDMLNPGYCPTGLHGNEGKCFFFDWEYTDYNVTST